MWSQTKNRDEENKDLAIGKRPLNLIRCSQGGNPVGIDKRKGLTETNERGPRVCFQMYSPDKRFCSVCLNDNNQFKKTPKSQPRFKKEEKRKGEKEKNTKESEKEERRKNESKEG